MRMANKLKELFQKQFETQSKTFTKFHSGSRYIWKTQFFTSKEKVKQNFQEIMFNKKYIMVAILSTRTKQGF